MRWVCKPLGGGRVGVRVLESCRGRIAPFEHVVKGHLIRGLLEEPWRIAAVAPLVPNHRTRPQHDFKTELVREPQQTQEIAPWIGRSGEIEYVRRWSVPVPNDVQIDGIDAEVLVCQERGAPLRSRNPFVEERRAVHEERASADGEDRIAVVECNARRTPAGPSLRGNGAS